MHKIKLIQKSEGKLMFPWFDVFTYFIAVVFIVKCMKEERKFCILKYDCKTLYTL